jgi:hypothetical protein
MGMRNLDDVGVVDPSDVLCDPWQTRVSWDKTSIDESVVVRGILGGHYSESGCL